MSILKLENVCYRYSDADKDDYVLKDISYEFDLNKMYAIKGKSGSGKTTLLSLISGLEKCEEGNIYFENKNLKNMDLDKYRNTNIGIVFQSFNLLPHLTAIENIILSMDIGEKGNRRVLKLSGGEQQRVAIARSLSYNPKLILADEPTGNLDKDTENDILDIFRRLSHEDKKCIIIVTHSDNVANNVDIVFDLKRFNNKI